MAADLDRAILLYQQSRYDQAEQALGTFLLEEPNHAGAHALLGLILAKREQWDRATAEIEHAIAMEPDWDYPHRCHSVVLNSRNRYVEAEQAAREAVRLDPTNAENYSQLAATLINQHRWQAALDTAMLGLEFDAEHANCDNFRTFALTKLGRQDEVLSAVDDALSRDPQNDVAHANKGWALLHQGKPKQAQIHFREALRIDPNYEYAKSGLIESLKATNWLYRWMLSYFLWMSSLSGKAQWAIIIGLVVGNSLLKRLAKAVPELAPYIWPITVAYLLFVVLTWFSVPFFNLLLRFHPLGKYSLSRDQRVSANWFAGCLLVALVCLPWAIFTNYDLPFLICAAAITLALPLTFIYFCDVGWPRKMMAAYAAGMALVALLIIASAILKSDMGIRLITPYLLATIASPFVANYLGGATVTK
jgi:tetratricopeptide (TPR) repeat protein